MNIFKYDNYVVKIPWEFRPSTKNVVLNDIFNQTFLRDTILKYPVLNKDVFLYFNCKLLLTIVIERDYNCYYCLLWLQKGAACIKFNCRKMIKSVGF